MSVFNVLVLMAVMALTTYLVRMIPFLLFRKKIESRFIKSLLYYIPYAILAAMTIPGIFYSTGSLFTAVVGFAAALVLSLMDASLVAVSLTASAAAALAWLIEKFLF